MPLTIHQMRDAMQKGISFRDYARQVAAAPAKRVVRSGRVEHLAVAAAATSTPPRPALKLHQPKIAGERVPSSREIFERLDTIAETAVRELSKATDLCGNLLDRCTTSVALTKQIIELTHKYRSLHAGAVFALTEKEKHL